MQPRRQLYAAVCGNGHILEDTLDRPYDPGTGGVPGLCPRCSAPVFTHCTNDDCDGPINGMKASNVIQLGRSRRADWFCQQCGRPYRWATPEQIRSWLA